MKYKKIDIVFVFVEIIGLWWIASILINKSCLPDPFSSIRAFFSLLGEGTLLIHTLASLKRILLGTLFGVIFAIPVGVLLGYSKVLDRYLGAAFNFLYTIPKVVFLPVIVVLLGIGDLPKVFLIALVLFFQQAVVIRDAVQNIPREMLKSIEVWGASKWQILTQLIIPACMPDIMTALRSTLGTSFALLFITETFASVSGLGYFITNCMDRRNYEEMYAAIVMLALMGTILYALIGLMERKVCKWKFLQ